MMPANVTASTVSFTLPYDRLAAPATHSVDSRMSPTLSHMSSRSSSPCIDLPPPQPSELLPAKPPDVAFPQPLMQLERPITESPMLPERAPKLPEKSAVRSGKRTALSEKPTPPYLGYAGAEAVAAVRPGRPASPHDDMIPMLATNGENVDVPVSKRLPADEDSTDEDVATATECQRIESPKPVRRAGDDNRSCETKVI